MSCRRNEIRFVTVTMVLIMCAVMGCQGIGTPKTAAAEKAAVQRVSPPSGQVLEVRTNGECLIDIGTDVGVADGDWVLVMRKGETIQYLEVISAKGDISYCRVAMTEEPVRVKVDDRVVLEPKRVVMPGGKSFK